MRITVFRTVFRRSAAPRRPGAGLLRNYLARAQAIADAGGGTLWLIEPGLRPDALPGFTDDVVRHLAAHGVVTGDVAVLQGRTSARIAVLAAPTVEIALPEEPVPSRVTR